MQTFPIISENLQWIPQKQETAAFGYTAAYFQTFFSNWMVR